MRTLLRLIIKCLQWCILMAIQYFPDIFWWHGENKCFDLKFGALGFSSASVHIWIKWIQACSAGTIRKAWWRGETGQVKTSEVSVRQKIIGRRPRSSKLKFVVGEWVYVYIYIYAHNWDHAHYIVCNLSLKNSLNIFSWLKDSTMWMYLTISPLWLFPIFVILNNVVIDIPVHKFKNH